MMGNNNSGFYFEAEHYHLSDVHQRFKLHPEGLPRITRNCVILGRLGVGKTMILKELCYKYRDSASIFPIYVPVGNWINKIRSEMVYPLHTSLSPYESDLITCTKILLSLALLEKTCEHGGYDSIRAAIELVPSHPNSGGDFCAWKNNQLKMIQTTLENGAHLPNLSISYPSLFSLANAIGEVVRAKGKTALFLIDQVDKLSLRHFEILRSLLQRGEYIVVIATRPCPCAPDPSALPPKVITDVEIWPLGENPRTRKWGDFVREVLSDSPYSERTKEISMASAKLLASLAGASVRTVLRICERIESGLKQGMSQETALDKSIGTLADEEKRITGEAIGAWCLEEPDRIVRFIAEKAAITRQEKNQRPGPTVLCIRATEDLFISEEVKRFLRVCVQNGIFIPLTTALDLTGNRYEINPLLIAPSEPAYPSKFSDEICEFEIESKKFDYWVRTKPAGGPPIKKKVFVPYWMSDPEEPGILSQRLRERALGHFEVLTGEDTTPGQWSPKIKKLIQGSHVVVCDLSAPRRDVYVEWGWAIGLHKQVLLGCKTRASRERNPQWVQEGKIYPYENESEMDVFMSQLLDMLDIHPDRVATWYDNPLDESMELKPEPTSIVLVGHGNAFEETQVICESIANEHGLSFESLLSETKKEDVEHGGILYQTIPLARQAGTLVLILDASEADFLTCVAGGIFTSSRSYVSIGSKRHTKKLFLINSAGPNLTGVVPGLLKSRLYVNTYYTTRNFQKDIHEHIVVLNKWRKQVISQAKHLTERKERK